ncbi:hypothetical protein [Streptomyces sp. NBC_01451]|uniref:hypothetical protein n=1 Tax=Streptomyces sp. NBC_01451 TaxID=2903872 RepID=UPI002E366BC5|nr:hypothetical protein [Streptomyces sp. NBC_01451]
MNTQVWRNTRSNDLLFHAFPEGAALCNKRIKPNEGDYVTADAAKAQPMTHLCERCEFRMAHLERKAQAEANPIQTLAPADAQALANSEGHVLEFGSAKEYKRPQGFPKIVRFVPESNGRMVALVDTDGNTYKRVRADHKFFVRSVPDGYASRVAQAQAEALADLDSDTEAVTLVEVVAPVAQAERETDVPQLDARAGRAHAQARMDLVKVRTIMGAGEFWFGGRETRKNFDGYPLRARFENAANNRMRIVDADNGQALTTVGPSTLIWAAPLAQADAEAVSAQDMADAALASGECEWTDAQVADAQARAMRLVTPAELESLANEDGEIFWGGMNGRPASSVTRVRVVRHGGTVHLLSVETGMSVGNVHASASWAAPVDSGDARPALRLTEGERDRAAAHAQANKAEREALERARAQAERLRNRKALTVTVPVVKAPANFRDLAWHANTEKARAWWKRRCLTYSMVETVKAHAQANYDLGWDTVVEAYEDAEILAYLNELDVSTVEGAIKAFDDLADEWASRQCGALVDGYGV